MASTETVEYLLGDDDFSLLLEVAHCALDGGLAHEADVMMQALAVLRPDNPHPQIGIALAKYVSGDRIGAIEGLLAVLDQFPEAVFSRSLLAKFMKESGQAGWEAYARESLDMLDTGISAEMARSLLGIPQSEEITPTVNQHGVDTNDVSIQGPRAIDVFLGRRA